MISFKTDMICYREITVKDKTILRRVIDTIGHISGFFSATEPEARHNSVLAKWEQYYDARPNSFAHRRQHRVLNYLTPAD